MTIADPRLRRARSALTIDLPAAWPDLRQAEVPRGGRFVLRVGVRGQPARRRPMFPALKTTPRRRNFRARPHAGFLKLMVYAENAAARATYHLMGFAAHVEVASPPLGAAGIGRSRAL